MVGMLVIFSTIGSTIQESGFAVALTNQGMRVMMACFYFSTLTA
jgi:hypothetical protein